jgi:hypothetical protein
MKCRDGRLPAKAWADQLGDPAPGEILAAATVFDRTLRCGRPWAGRLKPIAGSPHALMQLKITSASQPPYKFLVGLIDSDGRTLWAAAGFTSTTSYPDAGDVAYAEAVTEEWLQGGDL